LNLNVYLSVTLVQGSIVMKNSTW